MKSHQELPAWLWLWFPMVIIFLIITGYLVDPGVTRFLVGDEQGFIEPATVIILLPAVYFGFQAVLYNEKPIGFIIRMWILLVTLACIYIAGEEISWGQQLFQWETPDFISRINDQKETNIHNINSWFDQKPRLLLELWVFAGGILMPVWRLWRNRKYSSDNWQFWFWPSVTCLPTAILAILVKMPERLDNYFNIYGIMYLRYSELQEFYFALFLFIYLYSLKKRSSG